MISAAHFRSFLFKRGETLQTQSYRQKQTPSEEPLCKIYFLKTQSKTWVRIFSDPSWLINKLCKNSKPHTSSMPHTLSMHYHLYLKQLCQLKLNCSKHKIIFLLVGLNFIWSMTFLATCNRTPLICRPWLI